MPAHTLRICAFVLCMSLPAMSRDHPVKLEELLTRIARADKVVVSYGQGEPAYTSTSAADIAALKAAITIEPPQGWFRCACMPELVIQLFHDSKEIGAVLVYPDGLTIGFKPWASDARILNKEAWMAWFDTRRISNIRQAIERDEAREKRDRANEERWMNAIPASIRPLWPETVEKMMPGQTLDMKGLDQALAEQFPKAQDRIRALISWYGSGAGPWSGYPMYEDVAQQMLLEYSTVELLAAIQSAPLSDQEKEGAARVLGGWEFNRQRPQDNALIPPDLKKVLLDHSLQTADEDKAGRARHWFGGETPRPNE